MRVFFPSCGSKDGECLLFGKENIVQVVIRDNTLPHCIVAVQWEKDANDIFLWQSCVLFFTLEGRLYPLYTLLILFLYS